MGELVNERMDFQTNTEGFLLDWQAWRPEFAAQAAGREGLVLTPEHMELLQFLRSHFQEFGFVPPMRLMAKAVAKSLGAEKASSRYLYQLFPDGPAKQGSKLAGLPKPVSCI